MLQCDNEKELKELKITIKNWESEFAKSNQRKPQKEDIELASAGIKDAYKSYWTLKKKCESENQNREDVWSEKFNKSYKGDRIFQKYCNKIRERSCDATEINVKNYSQKKKLEESHISVNLDEDMCKNYTTCDTTNSDNINFNNFKELEIVKPVKKIMKLSTTSKYLKSVNILSSTIHTKSFEKRKSFETSINSEWLERCCRDTMTQSNGNEEIVNSTSDKKLSICDDEQVDIKINQHNKIINKSQNILGTEYCVINSAKHLESYSLNSSDEVLCERIVEYPAFNTDINEKNCVKLNSMTDIKQPECESPIKNQTDSDDLKIRKRKLSNRINSNLSSHLERKMASGTLNENYVKVNIKKKKFSRGHRSINVRKLKWQKWKELKKYQSDVNISSPSACFKCGQVGHWARNCKMFMKNIHNSEIDIEDFDDAPLPTLEEAADLETQLKNNLKERFSSVSTTEKENLIEKDSTVTTIKPIYQRTPEGNVIETPTEVFDSLKEFGYSDFRKGQESAVMRILSGLSTLVVLPTGSGKSLCYQLPAYIYSKQFNCLTIVISPLVSLMEDQITGLPPCLHAICLHSGMTDVQKKASLQDLSDGKAHILLVSPEAVIGGLSYGSGMLSINMPPIAFACIDEVHCLSQWSHNFRPSYLQLYKVLTERFNVKCILGLTATANQSTAKEIISHLGLNSIEESVIGSTGIPENLHLSVSRDKDKDKALIQLLTGERFSNCSSIIIYCIRRDETERLATYIRTVLQDQISDEPPLKKKKLKSKKRNFLWTAEAYHAGIAPPRRRSIQKQFMSGKLRVIVATIAFGMGLDKRDVRAVIHYNMPKSFESYVQEIGRAGRDGFVSHCHLFLDNEGKDIQELQRFIYANSTDRYVIRKLLKKVFLPCQCKASVMESSVSAEIKEIDSQFQANCPKHEIAFSISETVQELDLKEENILTLLCYLELHPKKWIEVLSPTYSTCSVRCYGGAKQLRSLALKSPPIAAAFALDAKRNKKLENISSYEFAVIEVASVMGWNASSIKHALKKLEWNGQNQKSGVIIEFSNLSFHLRSPGNLSDDDLDEVLDFLYQKVVTAEKKEISNLKSLHSIFSKNAHEHYLACSEEAPAAFSEGIKEEVNKYFDEVENIDMEKLELQNCIEENVSDDIDDIRSQIRDIIFTNTDHNFTGRAIARIFHGIGSPCFPPEVWGKVRRFWRCLLHINFNLLIKLANEELKKSKT